MFKTLNLLLLVIICQAISGSVSSLHAECDPTAISSICGQYERCASNENDRTKFYCSCQRNYEEINGKCNLITTTTSMPTSIPTNASNRQASTTSSSGSSIAMGILIPTFLIILGGLGFCCAKRYRLLPCRQNRYGNVLVTRDEDDDDDPPIA